MGFLQDIKFGFRMLLKHPGFTLVAVITIALGIGVNSTVFTLTNAVLLRGLPFKNPEEILHINSADRPHGRPRIPMSYKDFVDIREQARSFTGVAAIRPSSMDLSDEAGNAERVNGACITANTFSLLGQSTLRGRDFNLDEDKPAAFPVALIGYGLWQKRYGGDEKLLGRSIRVDQKYYTIVGIMPQGMKFPNDEDLWIPLTAGKDDDKRDSRSLSVIGRLRPGINAQQAAAELRDIARRLAAAYPESNRDIDATVLTTSDFYNGGSIRTVFLAMEGAVGFVLLIACANVANLLLSRAIGRTRETSIRAALGANRWRVVRQLLVESVILSFIGGSIGLALSVAGVRLFSSAVENTGKPYWIDFTMDYHVALFFVGVCVLTGILFGLVPALQISKSNLSETLKEGGRGSSGGRRARRLTGGLLIGEMALTIVLLAGAGLMIRSFLNTEYLDLGMKTDRLLVARVAAKGAKYPEPANVTAFEERLVDRLSRIQGIEAFTIASNAPAGGAISRKLRIEDRNIAGSNNQFPLVDTLTIAPGYFQALGIRMMQGREFTSSDGRAGSEGAIVNESFARQYWPGENIVGKRIRLGPKDDSPWIAVIGVSPKIFQSAGQSRQLNDMYPPTVYVPFRQDPAVGMSILVRTRAAKEVVTTELRTALQEIDPDLPLFNIFTMDEMIAQRNWPYRVFGSLFAIFALIALVMSSVGIYAVTAYGINQRTQEIGVRMALGAGRSTVLWMVLRQALTRIAIGLSLGLIAAVGFSRILNGLLFQVSTSDPATFALISAILAGSTVVASLVPARRAMAMNPVAALRAD